MKSMKTGTKPKQQARRAWIIVRLIANWLAVLLPLAWGIMATLQKVSALLQ